MNFLRKISIIIAALFVPIFFASCGAKGSEGAGSSSPADGSDKKPNGYYSVSTKSDSDLMTGINDEEEPVTLSVAFSDGAIEWDDVSAHVYIVKIDGKQVESTGALSYVPSLSAGIYTAEVVAYLSFSPTKTISGQVEIFIPASPPTLFVEGDLIFWSETEGAAGYDIYKDGSLLCRVTESRYLAAQDGLYSVKVVFDDARMNSAMSEAVVVGEVELSAPIIRIDGDFIRWSAVPGAQLYVVYIEGAVATVCVDTFFELSLLYSLQYAQDYPEGIEVAVSAKSENADDSPLSNTVIYKK